METNDLVKANGEVKVQRKKGRAPTARQNAEGAKQRKRLAEANKQYGRGPGIVTRRIKDKKLRGVMGALEERNREAVLQAKDAEVLLEHSAGFIEAEGEMERTYKVQQDEIKAQVGIETAKMGFELKLPDLGPYVCDYMWQTGRDLLLAGRKGHVATMDWRSGKLGCELQLGETVRDAKWLHNNQYFAVAQKRHVYIYDGDGVELHSMDQLTEVTHMEFLPNHFLLATIGNAGWLKWLDTSTGQLVMQRSTKKGKPEAFAQNPYNAVVHVGHQDGTVTLWAPNQSTALAKVLAHRGSVRSLAIDREGRYMVSTGQDLKMAVWDIRNFRPVHTYALRRPGSSVAISDGNLTAVGWGTHTTIWKDLFTIDTTDADRKKSSYLSWGGDGQNVERVRWCPEQDVLGIAHDSGFSSIIVPGAAEPNYDALERNPYQTVKQRQESEVQAALTKLKPEMIALDPNFIGRLDTESNRKTQEQKDFDRLTGDAAERKRIEDLKNRGRGKNSSLRKYLRKKGNRNVMDMHKQRAMELREELKQRRGGSKRQQQALPPSLARFA
ncbi:WD40 repeat-like protein [Piedraia hortae CBS 480.64]|uniref:U three protein 7 n=1 Tax=Piedraia hortae CBS 480.64 TaxID=1314780 RepID=A0A6A7C0F7_9PEZI|nr:WD40 repeat-like protein [Piedraia hortae CBS 480.64]